MSSIKSIVVTSQGSGYVSAPSVAFSGGGGSGATATAVINASGKVIAVVVTNGGSGYTSKPVVNFSGGGGGTGAVAYVSLFAMSQAYDIYDLLTAKVQLSMDLNETNQDEFLQSRISWISNAIETYIRNKVVKQEVTEIFTGEPVNCVYPSYFPIVSVSKLQYVSELKASYDESDWVDYATPYVLVSEMFNDLYISRAVLMTNDVFSSLIMGSRIIYNAGWERDLIPSDILIVFTEMLQRSIAESKSGGDLLGVSQRQKGNQIVDSVSYINLNPRWTEILDKYRRNETVQTIYYQR